MNDQSGAVDAILSFLIRGPGRRRVRWDVVVKEAALHLWCRKRAGIVLSKYRVTPGGDKAIDGVAHGVRQERGQAGQGRPWLGQIAQKVERPVGANEKLFVRHGGMEDDHHGFHRLRPQVMARQDLGGEAALQGRKAEPRIAIVAKHKPHRSITESANSVIQQDGMRLNRHGYGLPHGSEGDRVCKTVTGIIVLIGKGPAQVLELGYLGAFELPPPSPSSCIP